MRVLRGLVVVAFAFAALGAGAADLEAELKRCAGVADSLQRLVCYDSLARALAPAARPAAAEQGAGQCQATTKKGTQCSRRAKPGSRYCWQHQR